MSAMTLKAADGGQGAPRPSNQLPKGDVTKVVCGKAGKKREADVRRRGAMCNTLRWIFLKIVRRQVVVLWADKALKEPPRAPRHCSEKENVLACQSGSQRHDRLT